MALGLLSLDEAAERLGVSRRRAEAMVQAGQLAAERVGARWVVSAEAVRSAQAHRLPGGRPVKPTTAWKTIGTLRTSSTCQNTVEAIDLLRRKVRPRAKHLDLYVHPAMQARMCAYGVLGGRDAAQAAGAPVEPGTCRDLYLKASVAADAMEVVVAEEVPDGANVVLHVVDDEAWPFDDRCRVADPWVAWLDLADRDDRAADTILDRLVGGRIVSDA